MHERRQRKLHTIGLRDRKRRILEVSGQCVGTSNCPTVPAASSAVRRGRGRPRKHKTFGLGFTEKDPLPPTAFDAHHHVSKSCDFKENLSDFSYTQDGDPALKDFLPRLKDHLIARLLKLEYDGEDREFSDEERSSLQILHDRVYRHKVCRVNYTTYDMRRDQSSINPRTHADIMVLAHEDYDQDSMKFHPYWYARVLGVFHVIARYNDPNATRAAQWEPLEFLRIRWFGRDMQTRAGFRARRLYQVGFVDEEDPAAYGFLDPQHVIRAVHLIPAFHHMDYDEHNDRDNKNSSPNRFYVNIFADRDMFIRFMGGGIGHKATGRLVRIEDVMDTLTERAQAEDAPGSFQEPTLFANDPFTPPGPASDGAEEREDFEDEQLDYGYSDDRSTQQAGCSMGSGKQADGSSMTQENGPSPARKRKFDEFADEDEALDEDIESDWCGPEDGEDGVEIESDYDIGYESE